MNTKMKPLILAILVATSFSLISCNKTQSPNDYEENSVSKNDVVAEKKQETKPVAGIDKKTDESFAVDKLEDKKFAVNASAVFTVEDVLDSANKIEELTKKNKGFVEASRIENKLISHEDIERGDTIVRLSRYVRTGKMIVRVPKENVSQFFKKLQKQVKFLQASEFNTKDVILKTKNAEVQQASQDSINYSTIELSFSQPESIYQKTMANTQQLVNSYEPNFQVQLQESLQTGWLIFKKVILEVAKGWWIILLLIFFVSLWQILRFFGQRTPQPTKKLAKQLEYKEKNKSKSSVQTNENISSIKTETGSTPPPLPKITDIKTSKDTDKKSIEDKEKSSENTDKKD